MKCIISGINGYNSKNKNGDPIKVYNLTLLHDYPDTIGKVSKTCRITSDMDFYRKNVATFEDLNQLEGREVNAEWDVQTYGDKMFSRLICFDFLEKFYDIVERK